MNVRIRRIYRHHYIQSSGDHRDPVMEYLVDMQASPETRGRWIKGMTETPKQLIEAYEQGTLPIHAYGQILIRAYEAKFNRREELQAEMLRVSEVIGQLKRRTSRKNL